MESKEKIILIDTDIISHFIKGGEWESINLIFPYKLYALEQVRKELDNFKSREHEVNTIFIRKIVEEMTFPQDNEDIKKEYLRIKKLMFKGDGESACMAVARHNKHILASSNLKDIGHYCKTHGISYLTTMDFLCKAMRDEIFDEDRCNKFIQKVISAGSKLPVKKMAEYQCNFVDAAQVNI